MGYMFFDVRNEYTFCKGVDNIGAALLGLDRILDKVVEAHLKKLESDK